MVQKIAKVGVKKIGGYLYFVDKQGDISRAKMTDDRKAITLEKVARVGVKKKKGYLFFVDKQGDISAVKMNDAEKEKYFSKFYSKETAEFLRGEINRIGLKYSYREGALIAADIFEITYHREAIMVLGRTLEEAIDSYLINANKKHKIKLSAKRLASLNMHDKIGFMGSKKIIDKTQHSLMMALKWDRNIGSHPKSEEEIKNMVSRAKEMFSVGLRNIKDIQEKINKL